MSAALFPNVPACANDLATELDTLINTEADTLGGDSVRRVAGSAWRSMVILAEQHAALLAALRELTDAQRGSYPLELALAHADAAIAKAVQS